MNRRNTFPSHLRLKSRKQIDSLFNSTLSLFKFPLLLKYSKADRSIEAEDHLPGIQIVISVPKKNFAKAVHRNLLKRRIRESLRLQWREFLDNSDEVTWQLMIIYVSKEIEDYKSISSAVDSLLSSVELESGA